MVTTTTTTTTIGLSRRSGVRFLVLLLVVMGNLMLSRRQGITVVSNIKENDDEKKAVNRTTTVLPAGASLRSPTSPSKEHQEQRQEEEVKNERQEEQVEEKQKKVAQNEPQEQKNMEPKEQETSLLPPSSSSAMEHVLARRKAYEDAGDLDRWKFRGLGYLYVHKDIVLEAKLSTSPPQPGRNVVEIHNVMETSEDRQQQQLRGEECELLFMWVRVNGPELFAGAAQPVKADHDDDPCHWEFSFDLEKGGEYHIEVKLLLWNPHTTIQSYSNETLKGPGNDIQCPFQQGGPSNVSRIDFPFQNGFMGFKVYEPVASCCEICSRYTPHCKHWATPPDYFDEASHFRNGCELYFHDDSGMIPDSKLLPPRNGTINVMATPARHRRRRHRRLGGPIPQYHGDPHTRPTTYFLGCGWSFWFTLDYPCKSGDLDDRVYVVQPKFTFEPETTQPTAQIDQKQQPLPLCSLENEDLDNHRGRWVRPPFPNSTVCPNPMSIDSEFSTGFKIMRFDGTHPHCWHRDDFSPIGYKCVEPNCRLIPPESKFISDLHEEKQWYGFWKPYACDYLEFTNEQLQTCIDKKNITEISVEGASIARNLKNYLGMRLKHMKLRDPELPGSRSVKLSTLGMLHKVSIPDDRQEEWILAKNKPPQESEDFYWVSSFFLSSERCPHCTAPRMNKMNHIANKTLPPGWKMLNAFDMSAAFTYDNANQFDGMHIIGPTNKMIWTKLFHYVCKDTAPGSRVGSNV